MSRLAWSQLRFRVTRSLALLLGMLVAVTAFCVLTATARTSQLLTVGTVSAHFRAAYDILVRPQGARTRLESRTGTVQPNFLSGIYGGITLRQYHDIQQLPGVAVAAPIAMVGYSLPIVPVTARLRLGHRQPGTAPVPAPHDLDQRRGPHPDPAAAFLRVPDQRPDPAAAERLGRLRAVAVRGPGQHVCWLPAGHRRAAVRPGQTGRSLVLVADHRHGRRGFLGGSHGAASRIRGVLELPHADRGG